MLRRLRSKSFQFAAMTLIGLPARFASPQFKETKPNPPAISIAAGEPGTSPEKVPATLFGSFLEPIGSSINQGLSAELLVNGSLEAGLWNYANIEKMVAEQPELIASSNDTGLPMPWLPLHAGAGRRYELHNGSAANSWQSVEIMGYQNPAAGMMQRVYLPVQRTLRYRASMYVRHLSGGSKITVLLKKHGTDEIVAEATINAMPGEWTKYDAMLAVKSGAIKPMEAVDFAVQVEADERIDIDELSLMPDDAVAGLDPDVVAMAKAMNSTDVRLGGNFSSAYHWREGTGEPDKRITVQNIAWGIPEYNKFGTDEFLAFCTMIHAVPQIDLNMGSGTPEEAAEWVRYIRDHYHGKVVYELGNELYGNWQVGHVTADEIAARTMAFSRAVRAVDPKAELIATGGMPQQFLKWNAAQLTTPPGTFDFLSTHFIRVTNQVKLPDATPEFMAAAAYALPVELGRDFEKMQAQLDTVPALSGKVHFAMDEWLFNSRSNKGYRVFSDEAPSSKNEGGGLMVAGVFNTLVRSSRIVPVSEITGLMEFAGIWKEREQVYGTPAYYVFRMYTTIKGDTILPVTTTSGAYEVHGGVEGFTEMKDVPYVDAIATLSQDRKQLTVFCINRDLNHDLPVRIDLGQFHAGPKAEVEQLKSGSRYDVNDAMHPKNVIPQASTFDLPASGPGVYTLPHESVTMIRFSAR